jgi:hypothetical protein
VNTLTFDFPNLKDKVLSNKTRFDIGITQREEALVPWKYKMEVTGH